MKPKSFMTLKMISLIPRNSELLGAMVVGTQGMKPVVK
jgi:hypothetical protein